MAQKLAKSNNCMQCMTLCDPKKSLQWQDLNFCSMLCIKFYFEEEHTCVKCNNVIENFIGGRRLQPGEPNWYCSKECFTSSCVEKNVCDFCLVKKKNCAYGIGCTPTLCNEKCQKSYNGFNGIRNLYYCGICHLAKYGFRSENILIGEQTYHWNCWKVIDCRSKKFQCLTCKVHFYKQFNAIEGGESGKSFCSDECKLFFARENEEYVKCITCDQEILASIVITNRNGMIWCSLECLTGQTEKDQVFQVGEAFQNDSDNDSQGKMTAKQMKRKFFNYLPRFFLCRHQKSNKKGSIRG